MRPGEDDGADELAALRRRAYGPDADILGDSAALARLTELEERVRLDRSAASSQESPDREHTPESRPPAASVAQPEPGPATVAGAPTRPRRLQPALAAAAAAAVLLGGVVWNATRAADDAPEAAPTSNSVADLNSERDAAYRASYRIYLDGLRTEALSLPGGEEVAARMIRDSVRPYGILYGRTVAVGPTTDHRFCMIIADLPDASVACIPVDRSDAQPVSIELPAWYSDADSDLFTGLGEPVAYTLMPGGTVIAEPAAAAQAVSDADVPVIDNPGPAPTAVPPPGWQ